MTGGRWPSRAAARLLRAGGGRRIATLVLVGLLLSGIATLIGHARMLNEAMREARDAQSDNLTWLVSQLEVDFMHLRLTLAGTGAAEGGLAPVHRAFDIFYSRVDMIDGLALGFHPREDAATLGHLADIRAEARALAELADGAADLARAAFLDEMRLRTTALAPVVRDFALGGLQIFVRQAARTREAQRAVLQRFSALAIVLVVLLSGAIWLTADMYRDLLGRARAMRRVSSNLTRTIEASLDAVIITDGKGRIREYNRAAETIFGQPRAGAIGQDIARLLLPPPSGGETRCGIAPFLAAGAGQDRTVLTARHRDGHRFPLEAAVIADRDSEGEPIHIAFLRDITDRRAVESTLREARDAAEKNAEARARFLAVMSHEMRTPLHGVIAALDLMARGAPEEGQRRLIRIAQGCGQTALEQVEELLDLARRDDRIAETPAPFDPVALCAEIAENARPLADGRGNRIVLDLPGDGPGPVLGLRRAFAGALGNLVANAVKFTEGGRIVLSLSHEPLPEGDIALHVAVADEGIGIAPQDQARIFEDFETLDSSLTRAEGGTGLGLGIARRAVTALGGRIALDSAPGRGSTFRFTARMRRAPEAGSDAGAEAGPEAEPGPGPARRLSVLVVDDNPINLTLMQEMLSRLGHDAVGAQDGAGALAEAARRGFDVILMDVSMPGMDGLEATARLRAGGASAASPVIAVTAHGLPEDLARIRAAGVAGVLIKPVRLDTLERTLAALAGADPLLDAAVVADARALLPSGRRAETVAVFEAEYRAALAAIRAGGEDGAAAADRLHRLAGAAAVLGAARLGRRLSEAEALARRGAPDLPGALAAADAALADTLAALGDEAAGRPAPV